MYGYRSHGQDFSQYQQPEQNPYQYQPYDARQNQGDPGYDFYLNQPDDTQPRPVVGGPNYQTQGSEVLLLGWVPDPQCLSSAQQMGRPPKVDAVARPDSLKQ